MWGGWWGSRRTILVVEPQNSNFKQRPTLRFIFTITEQFLKIVLSPFVMEYLILLNIRFGWLQCLLYLDFTFSLLYVYQICSNYSMQIRFTHISVLYCFI